MSALVELSEIKTMLGIAEDDSAQDAVLNGLISAASELIEVYLRRKLQYGEHTDKVYQSGPCIWLRAYPVETILSIRCGETDISMLYSVDENNGLLRAHSEWPEGPNGYTITYRGGLKSIPCAIRQACMMLVGQMHDALRSDGKIAASERIGDYSITYQSASQGSAVGCGGLDSFSPAITALLRPYMGRMV